MDDRLAKQLGFIHEIDKIKRIFRKTRIFSEDRYENDAEHSWHICVMAAVLSEYANTEVDILRVIKMLLIHDIVEIDAGDVIVYDKDEEYAKKEQAAAKRIFGILPSEQEREFHGLWKEFEQRQTPEAKYAASVDRLEPILQNLYRDGADWRKNGITLERIMDNREEVAGGSEALWTHVKKEIQKCMSEQ